MAARRKKGEQIPEPPARKEIGTYDLKDYPHGELVDTGDGTIRRAWQISERVLIVIGGEKHAADSGDFVYELKLPGGAPGALEVLQADVAQGMGYEWREGREGSSPFPVPGTTAPAGESSPPTTNAPPGPPPEGTLDVYHESGAYLSSITTHPDVGGVIHLAGRGAFHVIEVLDDAGRVNVREANETELAQAIADGNITERELEERRTEQRRQDLASGAPADGERRTAADRRGVWPDVDHRSGFDRRQDPPDPDASIPDPDRRVTADRRESELDETELDTGEHLEPTEREPGAVAILESLIRWAKRQTKPWRDLSEKHQERELADLDRVITERVRDLVVDVAAREFPYVHATLEKVEFSEGIKATITIPSHSEHRHELADHAKQTVTIVLAGAATWTSGDRPRPDPDQPKLV